MNDKAGSIRICGAQTSNSDWLPRAVITPRIIAHRKSPKSK